MVDAQAVAAQVRRGGGADGGDAGAAEGADVPALLRELLQQRVEAAR